MAIIMGFRRREGGRQPSIMPIRVWSSIRIGTRSGHQSTNAIVTRGRLRGFTRRSCNFVTHMQVLFRQLAESNPGRWGESQTRRPDLHYDN